MYIYIYIYIIVNDSFEGGVSARPSPTAALGFSTGHDNM